MKFRCVAIDETEYFTLLKDVKVFGVYMFRVGAAEYCCTSRPHSWLMFVQNVFITEDLTEELIDLEYIGEDGYSDYIDVETYDKKYLSDEEHEVTFLGEDEEQEAYEWALEYFKGNSPYIKILEEN